MQLRNFPIIVLVLFSLVAACQGPPRPDLQRLYALQSHESIQQPPVVVIHGSMGARLSKSATGREIWTGSVFRILFGNYAELKLDIDPDTLTPGIMLGTGWTYLISGHTKESVDHYTTSKKEKPRQQSVTGAFRDSVIGGQMARTFSAAGPFSP